MYNSIWVKKNKATKTRPVCFFRFVTLEKLIRFVPNLAEIHFMLFLTYLFHVQFKLIW